MKTIFAALALLAATLLAAQPSAAPENPAALAEARVIVAKQLPPGTYKTLMGGSLSTIVDSLGQSIGALPLKQLAQLGGLDAKQAAALDKVDVARVMAIYDPHWQERTRLSMRAMFAAMGDFFTTMEPALREAYAKAYVHNFTLDELKDINRYFATPTGAKLATRYMTLATDPAILDVSRSMMPKMMAEMPRFVAAAQKATASLPPPRKVETLTPAERKELATALGVDPAGLKNPDATP